MAGIFFGLRAHPDENTDGLWRYPGQAVAEK